VLKAEVGFFAMISADGQCARSKDEQVAVAVPVLRKADQYPEAASRAVRSERIVRDEPTRPSPADGVL
jgi:hypothetical protein